MKWAKKWVYPAGLVLGDAAIVYLSFWIAYQIRFNWPDFVEIFPILKGTPPWDLYRQALRAVVPLWIVVFALWGRLYRRRFADAANEFLIVAKAVSLGTILIVLGTFLYRRYEYSRLVLALTFFISIFFLFAWRQAWKTLISFLYETLAPPDTVLVLGEGKSVGVVSSAIQKEPHLQVISLGEKDLDRMAQTLALEDLPREVFVGGQLLSNPKVLDLIDEFEDRGVEIKILPDFLEMRMGEISVDDSLRIPILHLKPLSLHGFRYFVKRLFDVSVSTFAVSVLFFPLLLLSILIALESRGGIFFVQDRVGFKEKIFKCLKFRTMRQDAETLLEEMKLPSFRGGPAFKMKGDPRITRVGRWVRKFSLDEFAQVWNVLKGEMSLIGPRPQVLAEANGNPEWAKKRYRILPGITGLWQVSGRADLSYEDMMRLDIYYLENWSPGLDLKILLKTLPVVLGGKGAY